MTVVSLLTPSFVARETGYALSGDWMDGDRVTNEYYAPLETFEERFGELLALTRSLGFDAIDLWTAHLGPGWARDEHLVIARALLPLMPNPVSGSLAETTKCRRSPSTALWSATGASTGGRLTLATWTGTAMLSLSPPGSRTVKVTV